MTYILFVIHRLDAGGAEKSLVSLLNSLPKDKYKIDLLAFDNKGLFRSQIPQYINIIEATDEMKILSQSFSEVSNNCTRFSLLYFKFILSLKNKVFRNSNSYSSTQYLWKLWNKNIQPLKKQYDIAISYMNGYCNYYVIDKVLAKKKILYMHNDYNEIDSVASFDLKYFSQADILVTISKTCADSLISNFPTIQKKVKIIENITSRTIIDNLKQKNETDDYFKNKEFKILSIGRLTEQKGFDLAIKAASILKNKNYKFTWYVLGEGELKKQLSSQIHKYKIDRNFKLIGVRANPYPYIYNADAFVMTSKYEGKSIALEEAKIIGLPIIVTNFPSVNDSIQNGKNGIVVKMNPDNIADAIISIIKSKDLRDNLTYNLRNTVLSNEQTVIQEFISMIEN